ncbi:MAG: 4-vinyl reductase [Candidatus Hadarchaeales archaeon]
MEDYRKAEREIAEYLRHHWKKAFELWMGCLVDAGEIVEFAPAMEVREDIWRDTCNTFLYDTGFKSGKRVAQWLYRTFDLGKKSLKERTIYTDIFFSQSGMGEIELLKGEEGRILRFRGGSYIAKEMGRVGRKVCYYLAGFIAGATQHFTGKNYRVEELRCYSNRNPHCEFLAKPLYPL